MPERSLPRVIHDASVFAMWFSAFPVGERRKTKSMPEAVARKIDLSRGESMILALHIRASSYWDMEKYESNEAGKLGINYIYGYGTWNSLMMICL